MITFKTAALVSTLAFIAMPLSATANHSDAGAKYTSSAPSSQPSTQRQPVRIIKERVDREVVLSSSTSSTRSGGYFVQNDQGNRYINHNVTPRQLSPVKTNIQFTDSYEFNHNGRTYKNKIVRN